MKILAAGSMKLKKLKWHLGIVDAECDGKNSGIFS
jgi:hypothetical protein